MKRMLILAGAFLASMASFGSEYWAAGVTNVVIDVAAGETKTASVIDLMDGATIEKRGAGELVVPLGGIIQTEAFKMKVSEGSVKVTGGSAPTLEKPTEILNKAALWLDADAGIVEDTGADGGKYVKAWHDVRETAASAPYDYPYARGVCFDAAKTYTNYPIRVTSGGKAAVDCKGFGSGAGFQFTVRTAEVGVSNQESVKAYDVFTVYRLTRPKYGFLFIGDANGQNQQPYHPGSSSIAVGGTEGMLRLDNAAQLDARWWYDGSEIDAMVTSPKTGCHVFGNRFLGVRPDLRGLGLYTTGSSYCDRNGFDEILEVILFTTRLTAEEHEKVERYLCGRYGQTVAVTSSRTFAVESGAEVKLDGVTSADVTVNGPSSVIRPSGGEQVIDYALGAYNDMTLDALDGASGGKTVLKRVAAIGISSGGILNAVQEARGTEVSLVSGAADELVKTGAQGATLGSVPVGVKTLRVNGGVLNLASATAAETPETVYATIPNASFDQTLGCRYAPIKTSNNPFADWTGHWWRVRDDWEDSFGTIMSQVTNGMDNSSQWYVYKGEGQVADYLRGNGYAALRGASGLSTEIEIPADGDYELSFKFSRRSPTDWVNFARLRVQIGDDLDHLRDIGYFIDIDNDQQERHDNLNLYLTWQTRTAMVYGLKKGTQRLMFRGDVFCGTADNTEYCKSTLLFDDVVLKKVADASDVRSLVGGDFEMMTTNQAFATGVVTGDSFGSEFVLDDWTCVQPASGTYAIGPVSRASRASRSSQSFSYYSYKLERGDNKHVQLLLGNKDGYATKKVFVPAGTWKLMADGISFHKTDTLGYATRGKTSSATVAATVTVGEGSALSLGTLSFAGAAPVFDTCWGTSFAVPDGGAEVLVKLQGTQQNAGAVLDNIRISAVVAQTDGNLVVAGDFAHDIGTAWTYDRSRQAADTPLARVAAGYGQIRSDSQSEYQKCYPKYNGQTSGNFGLIGDCGAFYQNVDFPSAGRYRLVYHTRSRNNWSDKSPLNLSYGQNRLLSYVAANGKTNTIDIALVDTTNWVQHAAVFTVQAPGTWSFGFQGLNVPTRMSDGPSPDDGGWDKQAFVDGISIVKLADTAVESSVTMPTDLKIRIASGAKINLGFDGTNEVDSVSMGGRVIRGIVDAATYPDFVVGSGVLNATGKAPGLMLIVR